MSGMDFLAMPRDAMFDTRLSLNILRVLAAIAMHDRKGVNGRGCFASVATLAKIAGCDTRTVKRALSDLRALDYIRSEQSPADGRRQVHRVVYPSELGELGDTGAPYPETDRGHFQHRSGTSADSVPEQEQKLTPPKQRYKQIVRSVEADPGEPAPLLRSGAISTKGRPGERTFEEECGTYLRRVEDGMTSMGHGDCVRHADTISELLDGHLQHGEPLYHWAERLMSELEWQSKNVGDAA